MRIVLRTNPWPLDDALPQTGTIWRVSETADMENCVIDVTVTDITKLNIYYSGLFVKQDQTYYATATRILEGEITLDPIGPKAITAGYDGRTLDELPDIGVEVPYINISLDELHDDSKPEFTISLTSIRAGGLGHEASSWILKSGSKILTRSLNDTVNKTSLLVDKKVIKNTATFEVFASQKSNNGIQSLFGSRAFKTRSKGYVIRHNLNGVSDTSDFILELIPDVAGVIDVTKVVLTNTENGNIIVSLPGSTGNAYIFDNALLYPDTSYHIDIYRVPVVPGDNNLFDRFELTTKINSGGFRVVKSYKYENDLAPIPVRLPFVHPPFVATEIQSGVFIGLDRNTNTFAGMRYNKNTYAFTRVNNFTTSVTPVIAPTNTMMINLPLNKFLTRSKDYSTGEGTFRLYKYDLKNNRITLLKTYTTGIEDVGANDLNMVFDPGTENVYFIKTQQSTVSLEVLNFKTDEVKTLSTGIEFIGKQINLEILDNDKLLVVSPDSGEVTRLYNLRTNGWETLLQLPAIFEGTRLLSTKGKNGNIFFFDTSGKLDSCLEFDTYNYKFTVRPTGQVNELLDSLVKLQSGEILLLSSDSTTPKSYLFY